MNPITRTMSYAIALTTAIGLTTAAHADTATNATEPTINLTPIATWVGVTGNTAKFREDLWEREGWTGGLSTFGLEQKLGKSKDWLLNLDGEAIFNENDYKVQLAIAKPEVAFLRAGATQYRQYFNDYGGYYKGFTTPSFSLDQNLNLYTGNIFIDGGFQIPDGPLLTAGYERQFKDGTKSLLEWGSVIQNGVDKKIYPSFKSVDETVDILKLGLEHHISKVNFGDDFRFEHYNSDNTTHDKGATNLTTGANSDVKIHEQSSYDLYNNVFHMDSQLNNKVYWSFGFLFNTLTGTGSEQVNTQPFAGNLAQNWNASAIDYDQTSYVLNANAMFGPYEKVISFYTGLQYEHTTGTGASDATLEEINAGFTNSPLALMNSSTEKDSLGGTVGTRFTAIPFTTLYAEGKWVGDTIDLVQRQTDGSITSVNMDQTSSVFRQQYTVGLNSAPLRRVTLAAYYRYTLRNNDYSYGANIPDGYPGFLTGQRFATDEALARVTYRPCSKISLAFQYRYLTTTIDNSNLAASGGFVPAGTVQSSDSTANIYTANATFTPLARLYLTAAASWQQSQTKSHNNGLNNIVSAYNGNVNTYMAGAGYALDEKTDLTVDYTFASAENPAGSPDGLPLGWDYHQQGLNVGLTRRISNNLIARLRYGFYDYIQQSGGSQNNYWANLASASCTMRF